MALSKQPYKGARDFYPSDKRLQKYMFDIWRQVCERYGYEEYDAPILEPLEIYLAKTGEEIVNEQTYVFEDRGKRKVVIRPEMTPTVSRMVAAQRQELAYPLRWYSIPNLWRYERPQRGRLREHWQLNVDLFGVEGVEAELEMISMADAMFKAFGASSDMYEIRLNSRKLVDEALASYVGLDKQEAHDVAKLIDKKAKMERGKFISAIDGALSSKSRQGGAAEKLLALLDVKNLKKLPAELAKHPSVSEIEALLNMLSNGGIKNARFDIGLMRGFDYYTDIIFEVFDKHPDNNRSMLGGGRYDGLVGLFGVPPVPTVGFGWGDVTLANFLELHRLMPELKPETDAYVALAGDIQAAAAKPVAELRQLGINLAVDFSGRKLGDQLKTASKKSIRYVLVIGESELKTGKYNLKNLQSGKEQSLSLKAVAKTLKEASQQ
ncbi:MAG TPA: histidine--tRNA ligase [Candidatus Saccharimonadales bacterium]|nr:histidine--tRNA ligase [Candidatus Saccharimonadales bacterium]